MFLFLILIDLNMYLYAQHHAINPAPVYLINVLAIISIFVLIQVKKLNKEIEQKSRTAQRIYFNN